MKITVGKFRNKRFHRAVVHFNNLVTVQANGIMFMLIFVELIQKPFSLSEIVVFYYYVFFYKKLKNPIYAGKPDRAVLIFSQLAYFHCA